MAMYTVHNRAVMLVSDSTAVQRELARKIAALRHATI